MELVLPFPVELPNLQQQGGCCCIRQIIDQVTKENGEETFLRQRLPTKSYPDLDYHLHFGMVGLKSISGSHGALQ